MAKLRREGLVYEIKDGCYATVDGSLLDDVVEVVNLVATAYRFLREGNAKSAERLLEHAINIIKNDLAWLETNIDKNLLLQLLCNNLASANHQLVSEKLALLVRILKDLQK